MSVEDAYDAVSELYTAKFLNEIDSDTQSLRWLRQFAELAATEGGLIVDMGCGPGSTVNHLTTLGLNVEGIDLSTGQVEQARLAYPQLNFAVGDMTSLEFAESSLAGVVSRHSIIHMKPSAIGQVLREWRRVLSNGAPIFLSFFGSRSVDAHGTAFDHKVCTAYELFPATIVDALNEAGYVNIQVEAVPIAKGGRPFDHTTILAQAGERRAEPAKSL